MLDLIKVRFPFFLRSYSLKIFNVISTLILPIFYSFDSLGIFYKFMIIQSILFLVYDSLTQYFYLYYSDYIIYVLLIISSIFAVSYIGYRACAESITYLDLIIAFTILFLYPIKYFLLFKFNHAGLKRGFIYELIENILFLILLLIAHYLDLSIFYIVGVFYLRSIIYLYEIFYMPRKTWVDDFNLKNYFSFTQPLLLSTGINALIAYTPSHVLNQEVFGKYNFLIRLTNLMTEPVKILLNSNFYTSALSGNIADQNNIIEKLLRVFKYCCLILTFIGMWVPVVNSGYYWAVPMIVYFELEAFHYFNDRKIRGITRFNWLYNAIFLFCIYSFFVSLEQYWIIGIFFARFMALFAAKIVLDKFLK